LRYAKAVGILSVVGAVTSAAAQDHPTFGVVYNTTENHSLTYECSLAGNELSCEFTQTGVRKSITADDAAQQRAAIPQQYAEGIAELEAECPELRRLAEGIQSGTPSDAIPNAAEFQHFLSTAPEAQIEDLRDLMARGVDMCDQPTLENFTRFVDYGIEKRERTCKVWSQRYSQRFRAVGSERETWVVNEPPSGDCGLVNVSRFEKARDMDIFWDYYARKVVTNKQGMASGVIACGDFDENEYHYAWRSREVFLGCDYVQFGF
jgi:hypothetical protein